MRWPAARFEALDRAVLRLRLAARGFAALRLDPPELREPVPRLDALADPDEPLLERAELLFRVDAADRDRDAPLDLDLLGLAISLHL